jgi:hypothetical protein
MINICTLLDKKKPDVLWHYTSLDVLKNILSNDVPTFWLSEIRYLNDKAEYKYGLDIFVSEINTLIDKQSLDSPKHSMLNQIKTYLEDDDFITNVFILSLSEEKDLLSQWRAYTPNGLGTAIGLSNDFVFNKMIVDDNGDYESGSLAGSFLYPVIYEKHQQTEYAKLIIEKCLSTWNCPESISRIMREFISFIKHPAFSEEKEWRIVISDDITATYFRAAKHYLVPYIEYNVKKASIKKINIGPNPEINLCELSISMYLKKKGVNATITRSKIPYRQS